MKKISLMLALIVITINGIATNVLAGTLIKATIKDMRVSPVTHYKTEVVLWRHLLKLDATKLKSDPDKTELIYNDHNRKLIYANHTQETYLVIDEATLNGISGSVKSVMDFINQQMGQTKSVQNNDEIKLFPVGGKQRLAGMDCSKHLIFKGAKKVQGVWAAPWNVAGISPETLNGARNLAGLYENIMKTLGDLPLFRQMLNIPTEGLVKLDAYPVAVKQYMQNRQAFDVQLKKPQSINVSASDFQIPSDYRQVWLMP